MNPHVARSVAEFLIADFENEMQTTQRVLAAVPADRLDYQPDAKAKTGLGLVRHITLEARISDWLWYFCPCDQSSRLDFRGFLERNQATEGDTQWVNYKPRPFSSRSTGF